MKVIRELIDYFVSTSVLTQEDLRYLRETGWRRFDSSEAHLNSDGTIIHLDETRHAPAYADWRGEETSATLDEPPERKKSSGPHGPKPCTSEATAAGLEDWLKRRSEAWRPDAEYLAGLVPEGLRSLRDLNPEEAADLWRSALSQKRTTWKDLWTALLTREYHDWFNEPKARGRASKAFRSLLTEPGGSELHQYRWLLGQPHVADTVLFAGAQRALLRGVHHLLEHEPGWLATRIRREKCPAALLTLVLAEAGRRFDPAVPPGQPSGDLPDRPLPEPGDRLKALHAAALIHPYRVLPFLARCADQWGEDGLATAESYKDLGLHCPTSWGLRIGSGPLPPQEFPPVAVLVDSCVSEEDQRRLTEFGKLVRTVAWIHGISQFRLMTSVWMTHDDELYQRWLVQVTRFVDSTSRRGFDPDMMTHQLQSATELNFYCAKAPVFHVHETSIRAEILL